MRIVYPGLFFIAATTLSVNVQALELSIYGVGHVSADSNDDGNDSQLYIASNSSRLGFRGGQDLGNGLKAVFQFETGVDLSGDGSNDGNGPGTSNNLFSTARDSYAGLAGGFGTVVAGRLAALNQWLYDFNLFADQIGDLGNIWGGTGLPGRANSTIAYLSPKIADSLDLVVAYHPENGTTDADATVLKANFAMNDFKAGIGYVGLGNGFFSPTADDHTAVAITGSYALGALTIGGGYQSESSIGGVSGNDRDSYTLGAGFGLGTGTLKAQYTVSNADAANSDASQIAVGYDYTLNEATTLYVAYASTNNEPLAAFTANDYGHGKAVSPAAGDDPSSFSVGVVYKFDTALKK